MPVSHDAQVFPHFFTTNKRLYLPFLLLDAELAPIRENRSLGEEGMLCFTLKLDLNSSRFSDGWFDGQRIYGKQTQKQINNITTVTQNFTTNAVWFNGSWHGPIISIPQIQLHLLNPSGPLHVGGPTRVNPGLGLDVNPEELDGLIGL